MAERDRHRKDNYRGDYLNLRNSNKRSHQPEWELSLLSEREAVESDGRYEPGHHSISRRQPRLDDMRDRYGSDRLSHNSRNNRRNGRDNTRDSARSRIQDDAKKDLMKMLAEVGEATVENMIDTEDMIIVESDEEQERGNNVPVEGGSSGWINASQHRGQTSRLPRVDELGSMQYPARSYLDEAVGWYQPLPKVAKMTQDYTHGRPIGADRPVTEAPQASKMTFKQFMDQYDNSVTADQAMVLYSEYTKKLEEAHRSTMTHQQPPKDWRPVTGAAPQEKKVTFKQFMEQYDNSVTPDQALVMYSEYTKKFEETQRANMRSVTGGTPQASKMSFKQFMDQYDNSVTPDQAMVLYSEYSKKFEETHQQPPKDSRPVSGGAPQSLMTFKQFMEQHDNSITPDRAMMLYSEYTMKFADVHRTKKFEMALFPNMTHQQPSKDLRPVTREAPQNSLMTFKQFMEQYDNSVTSEQALLLYSEYTKNFGLAHRANMTDEQPPNDCWCRSENPQPSLDKIANVWLRIDNETIPVLSKPIPRIRQAKQEQKSVILQISTRGPPKPYLSSFVVPLTGGLQWKCLHYKHTWEVELILGTASLKPEPNLQRIAKAWLVNNSDFGMITDLAEAESMIVDAHLGQQSTYIKIELATYKNININHRLGNFVTSFTYKSKWNFLIEEDLWIARAQVEEGHFQRVDELKRSSSRLAELEYQPLPKVGKMIVDYSHGHQKVAGRSQEPEQPVMMTFKEFMEPFDDSINEMQALEKYLDYKKNFLDLQHHKEEWRRGIHRPYPEDMGDFPGPAGPSRRRYPEDMGDFSGPPGPSKHEEMGLSPPPLMDRADQKTLETLKARASLAGAILKSLIPKKHQPIDEQLDIPPSVITSHPGQHPHPRPHPHPHLHPHPPPHPHFHPHPHPLPPPHLHPHFHPHPIPHPHLHPHPHPHPYPDPHLELPSLTNMTNAWYIINGNKRKFSNSNDRNRFRNAAAAGEDVFIEVMLCNEDEEQVHTTLHKQHLAAFIMEMADPYTWFHNPVSGLLEALPRHGIKKSHNKVLRGKKQSQDIQKEPNKVTSEKKEEEEEEEEEGDKS